MINPNLQKQRTTLIIVYGLKGAPSYGLYATVRDLGKMFNIIVRFIPFVMFCINKTLSANIGPITKTRKDLYVPPPAAYAATLARS